MEKRSDDNPPRRCFAGGGRVSKVNSRPGHRAARRTPCNSSATQRRGFDRPAISARPLSHGSLFSWARQRKS